MLTREDLKKIESWLAHRTIKDSQLPYATELDGSEIIPIVQEDQNKIMRYYDLISDVAARNIPDLYNVSQSNNKYCITLEEAIHLIPVNLRKYGLIITFYNTNGNWMIYQFKGESLNQWQSVDCWKSIIEEALEELLFYPDEEDITGVQDGNRTYIKFKNKDYDPADFSGLGRIILRKNYVGTQACSIDDEDHYSNILTQSMISEPNTIYIIQYDFDLDGKVISIPKNSILWFQGGSLNNGTVYMNEAAVLGAFEFADMGDCKLFGGFNTGQIFTFHNDDYKLKEGNYFKASTKESSATKEEDGKQDKEVEYIENPEAYTTSERQELRWWNGEEWVLILDMEDYMEIKSIISDLVEKHNAEMSSLYKYFKTRIYALENRVDELERWRKEEVDPTLKDHEERLSQAETDIDNLEDWKDTVVTPTLQNHETRISQLENDMESLENGLNEVNQEIGDIHNDIDNINDRLDNIDNKIDSIESSISNITENINSIQDFISNIEENITEAVQNIINTKVTGVVKSIKVNGESYTPDGEGVVTLPDYPENTGGDGGTADRVKGTLTVKQGTKTLGTFNGETDTEVNIADYSDLEDRIGALETKYASILFLSSRTNIVLDEKQTSATAPIFGYNLSNAAVGDLSNLVDIEVSPASSNIRASISYNQASSTPNLLRVECNDEDSEVNAQVNLYVKGLKPSHLIYSVLRKAASTDPDEPDEPEILPDAEAIKDFNISVAIYEMEPQQYHPPCKVYVRIESPTANKIREGFACEPEGDIGAVYYSSAEEVSTGSGTTFDFFGSPHFTKDDIVNKKALENGKGVVYFSEQDLIKAVSNKLNWTIRFSSGGSLAEFKQFEGQVILINKGDILAKEWGIEEE